MWFQDAREPVERTQEGYDVGDCTFSNGIGQEGLILAQDTVKGVQAVKEVQGVSVDDPNGLPDEDSIVEDSLFSSFSSPKR